MLWAGLGWAVGWAGLWAASSGNPETEIGLLEIGWAGLGWAGLAGWAGWAGWLLGNPETEIGLLENDKVVSRPKKNELPDG